MSWTRPQWLHWYGLSPVWVILSIARRLVSKKPLLQWLHWNGFSSVWVILCITRILVSKIAVSHWLHLHGFSPVCVTVWYNLLGVCLDVNRSPASIVILQWFHHIGCIAMAIIDIYTSIGCIDEGFPCMQKPYHNSMSPQQSDEPDVFVIFIPHWL